MKKKRMAKKKTIEDVYTDLHTHQQEDHKFKESTEKSFEEQGKDMKALHALLVDENGQLKIATKGDVEDILVESVKRVLKSSYGGLLVVAAIVGALVTIGVGAKWFFGVIGLHFIKS